MAGRGLEAISSVEHALELIPERPPTRERAKALASLAQLLMLASSPESGEQARRAIEAAREVGAADVEAHALVTLGVCEASEGRFETGMTHIRLGRSIAEQPRAIDDLLRSYANLSSILDVAGRLEEAVADAMEGAERSARAGLFSKYYWFHLCNAAWSLMRLGRWDQARGLLEGADLARVEGVPGLYLLTTQVLDGSAQRGFRGGSPLVETVLASSGEMVDPQFRGAMHLMAGTLAWFEGDLARAWILVERPRPHRERGGLVLQGAAARPGYGGACRPGPDRPHLGSRPGPSLGQRPSIGRPRLGRPARPPGPM